jgi:predicted GIY-YIG superfamily endonuclease
MNMYFVYLIECGDKSIYTGITTDLTRRLEEHKNGIGGRYTRSRKIIRILYSEKHPNRSAALKREAYIKSWSRAKKLDLIKLGK